MRESAANKAKRYLNEGRVIISDVRLNRVSAAVRGNGRVYKTGFSDGVWHCDCPTPTDRCSHLFAVRKITAPDVNEMKEPHEQQPRSPE